MTPATASANVLSMAEDPRERVVIQYTAKQAKQINRLTQKQSDALKMFLGKLSADPFDPEITTRSKFEDDVYVCELPEGCTVFWKVVLPADDGRSIHLEQFPPGTKIDLLEVRSSFDKTSGKSFDL